MFQPSSTSSVSSQWFLSIIVATIYILSGSTQPLLMTLVKGAGLGDPTCQVYMLFYYIGPAMVTFSLCCQRPTKTAYTSNHDSVDSSTSDIGRGDSESNPAIQHTSQFPSLITKASCIAVVDVIAQTMNYTGSIFAGPSIFAIVYSSVTIWTAVYSYFLLSRKLTSLQWCGVFIVFLGLLITSFNSIAVGDHVFNGTILIICGSSMHALTYVLSEIIMTREKLSLTVNCSVQAIVACVFYILWQLIYTKKHYHELIALPMMENGTTVKSAIMILLSLSLSNLIHALSFFYTLKCFPGGATSAGVMKGVQAVLVFVFSSLVYCNTGEFHDNFGGEEANINKVYGGQEMCFTFNKFLSLVVVLTGVMIYAFATDGNTQLYSGNDTENDHMPMHAKKQGYQQIGTSNHEDNNDLQIQNIS
jgi:drug/metabolite transporter (DMT)-like permease